MPRGRQLQPLAPRFWPRVVQGPGCWEWTGTRQPAGYGTISYRGKQILAHRASWILEHGEEPTQWVLHRCDNRACVRPDHLFLGDALANAQDRHAKGRSGRHDGERNGRAKLTNRDAAIIRRLYAAGGISQFKLADAFGVHQTAISRVIAGRGWLPED